MDRLNNNKKRLKVVSTLLMFALIFTTVLSLSSCSFEKIDTLIIYNWTDYISYENITAFEEFYKEQTGKKIKVIYSTFETNETAITTLVKGKEKVDLICPSDYAVEKFFELDLLQPLSREPGDAADRALSQVDPYVLDIINDSFSEIKSSENIPITDYLIPYMWGTVGILYNKNYVSEDAITDLDWSILWNAGNDQKLSKKILMKDSYRDTFCAAVGYLIQTDQIPNEHKGKSYAELINTLDASMLEAIGNVLMKQREVIQGYEIDFGKDDLVAGNAYLDLAWSGDAVWAIEEATNTNRDFELDYYMPKKTNLFFDAWVIPKNAPNFEAAQMFLEFMYMPENAIFNMLEIGWTQAVDPQLLKDNDDAISYIEEAEYDVEEFFTNFARYPDLSAPGYEFGVMRSIKNPNDAVALWEKVKTEDANNDTALLLAILLIFFVALAISICAYYLYRKLKIRPKNLS